MPSMIGPIRQYGITQTQNLSCSNSAIRIFVDLTHTKSALLRCSPRVFQQTKRQLSRCIPEFEPTIIHNGRQEEGPQVCSSQARHHTARQSIVSVAGSSSRTRVPNRFSPENLKKQKKTRKRTIMLSEKCQFSNCPRQDIEGANRPVITALKFPRHFSSNTTRP